MQNLPVVIESIGDDNYQAAIRFLAEWPAAARPASARTSPITPGGGTSLVTVQDRQVVETISILGIEYIGLAAPRIGRGHEHGKALVL